MPISYTSLATAFISLVAVIGLVVLAGRMARATGLVKSRQGQRLALRETLQIDRTRSLRIVSCDGREILLLIGGGSDVVLGWLPMSETAR
ncbi:MAG: hypothetical protein EOO77_20635 [Oxalobacteraceae bacterium]|nr:MAG: hypothetical protein EOO77_20635 [Oxalobacteraceae bacterium]